MKSFAATSCSRDFNRGQQARVSRRVLRWRAWPERATSPPSSSSRATARRPTAEAAACAGRFTPTTSNFTLDPDWGWCCWGGRAQLVSRSRWGHSSRSTRRSSTAAITTCRSALLSRSSIWARPAIRLPRRSRLRHRGWAPASRHHGGIDSARCHGARRAPAGFGAPTFSTAKHRPLRSRTSSSSSA